MALILMNGFSYFTDEYDHDQTRWGSGSGLNGMPQSGGPNGEGYWQGPNAGGGLADMALIRNATTTEGFENLILQFDGRVMGNGVNFTLFDLHDRGSETNQMGFEYIDASQNIEANRGSGSSLAASTGSPIVEDTWQYWEVKVRIHDTLGQVIINIDGTEVINSTGLDTNNAGTTDFKLTMFRIPLSSSNSRRFDVANFIAMDDTGPRMNDFLGTRRIVQFFPSVGTTDADWTRSSAGSTNWELVDDNPYDSADYVLTSSTGDIDRYGMPNLTVRPSSMDAVAVNVIPILSDFGGGVIRSRVQVSTDVDESTDINVYASGTIHQHIVQNQPGTTNAWSVNGIANATIGIRRI